MPSGKKPHLRSKPPPIDSLLRIAWLTAGFAHLACLLLSLFRVTYQLVLYMKLATKTSGARGLFTHFHVQAMYAKERKEWCSYRILLRAPGAGRNTIWEAFLGLQWPF